MLKIPYFKQNRDYTCGPACLRMVLAYYGIQQDEVTLTMRCGTTLFDTKAINIAQVASEFRLQTDYKYRATRSDLEKAAQDSIPAICYVDLGALADPEKAGLVHSVVLVEMQGNAIVYHDPYYGANQKATAEQFIAAWQNLRGEMISIWRARKLIPHPKSEKS